MVGSESIRSAKVPVQSIHPRPVTPSARDFHSKMRQLMRGRRLELAGASGMSYADLLPLLSRGFNGSVVRASV